MIITKETLNYNFEEDFDQAINISFLVSKRKHWIE